MIKMADCSLMVISIRQHTAAVSSPERKRVMISLPQSKNKNHKQEQ